MAVLLDTVTLDDWRTVVAGAKAHCRMPKQGACSPVTGWRNTWRAGRKVTHRHPLNVVVQQLSGADPVVNRLAKPIIDQRKYPGMHRDDAQDAHIRADNQVALSKNLARAGCLGPIERIDFDSALKKCTELMTEPARIRKMVKLGREIIAPLNYEEIMRVAK